MRKKVAFIVPTLSSGGAERVVSNLSLCLPDEFEKHIIVYDGSKVIYPYKGNIMDLNAVANNNPISKLFVLIRRVKKVKYFKRKNYIEGTVSFLENPNVVNILSH